MSRIIAARYYPHGHFLEAKLGNKHSATWSSIIKARPLLLKGLRIRIGNDYSKTIWDSPWITDDGHFKLFTPRPPSTYFPMKVADLIDPVTNSWNKKFIEETFWPIDCVRILSIPIGDINWSDCLLWHYAKNGRFSMKSAYQALFAEKGGEEASSLEHEWNPRREMVRSMEIKHSTQGRGCLCGGHVLTFYHMPWSWLGDILARIHFVCTVKENWRRWRMY